MTLRRRIAATAIVGGGLLTATVPFATASAVAAPAPAVTAPIPCPTGPLITYTPTGIILNVGCAHGEIPL